MFNTVNDIERIGDHAENIVELAIEKNETKVNIKGEAKEELINMYSKTLEAITLAVNAYSKNDIN